MSLKITTKCLWNPSLWDPYFSQIPARKISYDTFLSKAEESKEEEKFKDAKAILPDNHLLPSESEECC